MIPSEILKAIEIVCAPTRVEASPTMLQDDEYWSALDDLTASLQAVQDDFAWREIVRDARLGKAVRKVAAIWGDTPRDILEIAGAMNAQGRPGVALYWQAIADALEAEEKEVQDADYTKAAGCMKGAFDPKPEEIIRRMRDGDTKPK